MLPRNKIGKNIKANLSDSILFLPINVREIIKEKTDKAIKTITTFDLSKAMYSNPKNTKMKVKIDLTSEENIKKKIK